jgi:hypothetical protein
MADDFSTRQWHCRIQNGRTAGLGDVGLAGRRSVSRRGAGQQERIETAGKAGNSKPTLSLT